MKYIIWTLLAFVLGISLFYLDTVILGNDTSAFLWGFIGSNIAHGIVKEVYGHHPLS